METLEKQFILNTYAKNKVAFVSGKNSTLFDASGKDYIDFASGIGVVSVGHGNKQIADVMYEQAKKIMHTSNLFYIEPQIKLAQKIAELSGYDVATFFSNSGAEANEGAIKLARKYGEKKFPNKKRYKVLTLEHSFHGRTIATVRATGQQSFHKSYFEPYPDGFSFVAQIQKLYEQIDDETVAVMIELVQGEGGVEPFEKEQIQKLCSYLQQKEILLIVDEVQTGIYRSGEFLASNLYEITPDIITMAKGLGGGVPIGAVSTIHKEIFEPGDHGSTFGGNFLVTAVANETLEILEEYKQSGKLDERIIEFDAELKKIQQEYPSLFIQKVGLGLMRGLRTKDADTLTLIIQKALENGLVLLKAGKNTLRMLPPLTISKKEMQEGFKRLKEVLDEI